MELVNFSLYINRVLIFFSYSGLLGIFCSDGQYNTAWVGAVGAVGMLVVAHSISSHEHNQ